MTLEDLNQHLELITELARVNEMIQSLWNAAHPGGQVLTGMPHAPGVKDKIGDLACEIADLETDRDQLQERIELSEKSVMAFITKIPGAQTRLIFRLRFCRGLTWKEVAQVIGGGNTENGVRMVCYRYLNEE